MRIISGKHRGRKLLDFEGMNIRPTTDRVKESMFNLIQDYIADSAVLDAFCGSGALALEAMSRGAAYAVCTDKDKVSVDIITKNIQTLGYGDSCKVLNTDVMSYLDKCTERFDIIFLDPPYNKGFIEPVLDKIVKNGIMAVGGIIVLESDDTDFCGEPEGLECIKQRKYGRTYITVYKAG